MSEVTIAEKARRFLANRGVPGAERCHVVKPATTETDATK